MSATNVPELQPDTAMCEHCGKVISSLISIPHY